MFTWCDKLTSVTLPPTIREIRYGAFCMCPSLRSVNVPRGVKIGGGAFYGCDVLESLDLRGCTVQYHDQYDAVVSRCASLQEVYLPEDGGYIEYVYANVPYDLDPNNITQVSTYYFDYDDCPYTLVEYDEDELYGGAGRRIGKAVRFSRSGIYDTDEGDFWPTDVELQECQKLRRIHVSSASPDNIYKWDVFKWNHLYETCELCVPKGSVEAYRAAEGWSSFKSIVEDEEQSGVDVTAAEETAADEGERTVFDLSGRLRLRLAPGEQPSGLAPGIYVEHTPAGSRKFIVR